MAFAGWAARLQDLRGHQLFGAGKEPASIRYWQSRSFAALWPLLGAMVLLFGALPVLSDIHSLGRQPRWLLAANALLVAAYVIGIFWASIRQRYAALVVVVVLFGASMVAMDAVSQRVRRPPLELAAIADRLSVDVTLIAVAIAGSYTLFIAFLFRESGVLARLRGEVELAALIHARLVPPVDTQVDGWQCFGRSLASSEMGGDLLDVLPGPAGATTAWTAYVADVSGHGVGAGLFMGVVKTALRMALRQHRGLATALTAANAALHDQKRRDMFATLALVRGGVDGALTGCIAGHVPILHRAAATGVVTLIAQQQLPLGIRPVQTFALLDWHCAAGDLLAIVSDGITEVFDRRGRELGLDPVQACLQAHGAEPLPALYARLTALARAHGPIRDDETVLLLRRDA